MRECTSEEEILSNIIKKIIVMEKLMELTGGRCLLSLKQGTKSDRIQYHHLEKEDDGGDITYHNGVPLLESNHAMMHILERKDKGLYIKINSAMDWYKEALEIDSVLSRFYPKEEIEEQMFFSMLEDEYSDLDLNSNDNNEDSIVEPLSLEQLVEARKAIQIYEQEVVPAFLRAKAKYYNGELFNTTIDYVDFDEVRNRRLKAKIKRKEKKQRLEQKNKNT